MAWTFKEAGTAFGTTSMEVVFEEAPAAGELVILASHTDEALASDLVFPDGFTVAAQRNESNRSVAIAYKVAGASESASYTVTKTNANASGTAGIVWSGATLDSTGTGATASATNVDTITVGPITATAGGLCVVCFFNEGGSLTSSISDDFTNRGGVGSADYVTVATKVSAGGSESTTHTLTSTVTRQSAVLVEYIPAASSTPAGQVVITRYHDIAS